MKDYAVLVVNGSIKDIDFYKDILDNAKIVVASDGAANILYRYSKDIDYIIGDLDSISEGVLLYYKNKDVVVKRYPVKKIRQTLRFQLMKYTIWVLKNSNDWCKR